MERYYFCSTNQSAFVLDLNRSPEKQNDTGHEFTLSCGVLGRKGASDGMITDAKGTVYAGDYENNSIRKILPNGIMETIAHDPRILWPDTFQLVRSIFVCHCEPITSTA